MGERLRKIRHFVARGFEKAQALTTVDLPPKERIRLLRISNGVVGPGDVDDYIRKRAISLVSLLAAGAFMETGGTVSLPQGIVEETVAIERKRLEGLSPQQRIEELQADARQELKEAGLNVPSAITPPAAEHGVVYESD